MYQDKKKFDIMSYIIKRMTNENGEITQRRDIIALVENEVLAHLKKHPEDITYMDTQSGLTLGMLCALYGLEEVVIVCLNNEKARYQQSTNKDYMGYNIGMFSAKKGLIRATLKALDYVDIGYQQNADGQNIGMISAESGLEEAVIKSLNNIYASSQQDKNGNNIGMYSAKNKLERAVLKALDDPIASIQQNVNGDNIGMISARNGLRKATAKAQKDMFSVQQKNNNGETIESIMQANSPIM